MPVSITGKGLESRKAALVELIPQIPVLFPAQNGPGEPPEWYGSLTYDPDLLTIKPLAMLRWTLIFLVIAIIAAIMGFGGIAAGAASIAKILFYIFLVLFVLSLIAGGFRRVD